MRYASMISTRSRNLGDEIQSVAVEQLLPRVDVQVPREGLGGVVDDVVVVLNGWFGPADLSWPPSPSVRPVFFGFHVTDRHGSRARVLAPELRSYYEQHAPIGCRDNATRTAVEALGVEAETTWCATMTLPRRPERVPGATKVFLVNADYVPVPDAIAKRAVRISQNVQATYRPTTRRAMAEDLVAMYRDEARLVITTKIHCALPCAAMGIPTVFIGDEGSERLEPARQVLPVNHFRHDPNPWVRRVKRSAANRRFLGAVDWDPPAPEFEDLKARSRARFDDLLARALER